QIEPGAPFDTTGGTFILTSVSSNATFTATTSGTVMGDPHFTTYDGLHYDFQAAGQFVLTRSTVPAHRPGTARRIYRARGASPVRPSSRAYCSDRHDRADVSTARATDARHSSCRRR